jgi:hypothetical protein
MKETAAIISMTMMPPTTIPTFAPVLSSEDPADAPLVEPGTEAVVIATRVEVKIVSLRPMTVPVGGSWLQPASRATITNTQVSKKVAIFNNLEISGTAESACGKDFAWSRLMKYEIE